MTAVAVERIIHWRDAPAYREIVTWCPGCDSPHDFTVEVLNPEYRRNNDSAEPVWEWDGNLDSPTFSPSMLAYSSVHLCKEPHTEVCEFPTQCEEKGHLILNAERWGETPEPDARLLGHNLPHTTDPAWGNCHSFLRAGQWEFLPDSAHQLAGQTVPMVPLPAWVLARD